MVYKKIAKKTVTQINKKLSTMNSYHVMIPQGQIQSILEGQGVTVLDEAGYKFTGSFKGCVGSSMLNLGLTKTKKRNKTYRIASTCLMISWNCMASGSYEIISYLS